jgi:hypothetical protein
VKEQAGRAVSGEVRALMQKSNDRVGLMEKALAEGDDEVLSAVLGAPPMLSGLTKEIHAVFLRKYNEQRKPETMQRLRALQSARSYLMDKGSLVFKEMTKAVGTIEVRIKHKNPDRPDTIRFVGPDEYRAKRDSSAAIYKKHA